MREIFLSVAPRVILLFRRVSPSQLAVNLDIRRCCRLQCGTAVKPARPIFGSVVTLSTVIYAGRSKVRAAGSAPPFLAIPA